MEDVMVLKEDLEAEVMALKKDPETKDVAPKKDSKAQVVMFEEDLMVLKKDLKEKAGVLEKDHVEDMVIENNPMVLEKNLTAKGVVPNEKALNQHIMRTKKDCVKDHAQA